MDTAQLVMIEWEDSRRPTSGWERLTEYEPEGVCDCVSVGFLVHNGEVQVTASEEGFWADGIGQPHPRTAIGYTRDERIILMVVDGRQEGSPGVNLAQLADMLANVGCVEAINLDGGGSTALVANGVLINSPEGTRTARPVMSAIGIFCKLHVPPSNG
ncbi:MAG: phosphodiester glycosidase family protein [Candidatus Marinimicrobia bacterium]|nr:phosphodiester glycosidase family protein [Candidatus Neomarinimicrobiota bacterium]